MLQDRKILLGITGGIAAYKAAILIRMLIRSGAEVRVIMTKSAKDFITPLTLATLSKNPILVDSFDPEDGRWNSHISIAEWADLYIIAPATANTIAKMANGVADNLLLTTYLSALCPICVAPSMDLDMYAHPATQANIATLKERGVTIIEPDTGELASGLVGRGRMAEPEQIVEQIEMTLQKKKTLLGSRFIVTAGGTVEPIDLVRYISNHSTGKMGYSIAKSLALRGAEVVLVSAPTTLSTPFGVRKIEVTTAQQMYEATKREFENAATTGAIMCAAVADYTPTDPSNTKLKKDGDSGLTLKLKQTKDIAAEMGRIKGDKILVGFALEAENENENAERKLLSKNLDFIVLNSLKETGAGFGTETNKVTILEREGARTEFPLELKGQVAERIVDKIERLIDSKK